jgi:hypothetical protein
MLQMENGRLTQDVVSIELAGLTVRRNYDSSVGAPPQSDGTPLPAPR